jgi:hypothetical protein
MNAEGYLKNINIKSEIKKKLLVNLCQSLGVTDLSEIKNTIRNIVSTILPIQKHCINKKIWIECNKTCYSGLANLINIEISSSAYILRTIYNSLIPSAYTELELEINDALTGIWENDYNNLTITKFGNDSPRKLILGLGPSACGKTYWAKALIQTFIESSPNLPNLFLSIDGGIQRESSIVYQYILDIAREACVLGFINLVSTSYFSKTLFDSNIVKYNIIKFLQKQRALSLYVPETLSDCGTLRPQSCYSKIKKYIDITHDNDWISILIYQHRDGNTCKYPKGYRCVGCSVAGRLREVKEGKKYSDKMYIRSITESLDFLSSSSGMKYIIHNSGSKTNKSIIDDYTDYTIYNPIRVDIRENLMRNTNKYFYTLFSHSPDENIAINMNKINTNTRNNRNSLLEINTNREEFFTDLNIKGESTRVYGKTPKNLIGGRTRKKLKKAL